MQFDEGAGMSRFAEARERRELWNNPSTEPEESKTLNEGKINSFH